MKIEASTRLLAFTTQQKLFEFLQKLGAKEQKYFYLELPRLLAQWFDWMKKNSDHLNITFASTEVEAAQYRHVDAIAVALGHLRSIYTPKLSAMLYRSLIVPSEDDLPSTYLFDFKSDRKWSALQSWTYNKKPVVADRDLPDRGGIELILGVSAQIAEKHAVTDYVQLENLCRDMVLLCENLKKFPKQMREADKEKQVNVKLWLGLQRQLNAFSAEREVILYIPHGTSIKCTWSAYQVNRDGKRIKSLRK